MPRESTADPGGAFRYKVRLNNHMVSKFNSRGCTGGALMAAMTLAGLSALDRDQYLLFHCGAELFSIAVAWSVFLLVQSARREPRSDGLWLLGVAYFFIGLIDLLHTLAYKGMGVLPGVESGDAATQLWVAGRYMEAISLLLFALLAGRWFNSGLAFRIYGAVTALVVAGILIWDVFPACYLEGQGLTPFKVVSEYVICLILAAALTILRANRRAMDPLVFRLMAAAILLTIGAELSFTLYVDPYGFFNMAGHLLKIASYWFIYRALVQSALERPFQVLYRDLAESERRLHVLMNNLPGMAYRRAERPGRPMEFVSSGCLSLTGYRRPEIAPFGDVSYRSLIHPDDRRMVDAAIQEAVGRRMPFEVEYRIRTRRGRLRWVWERGQLVFDGGGNEPMIEGFITDITARREAELVNRFHGMMLRQISDAVIATDLDVRIISWNAAAESIYGWTAQEVMGRGLDDLLKTEFVSQSRAEAREALSRQGLWKGEVRQKAKDGATLMIEAAVSWILGEDGHIAGGVTVNRDITERQSLQNLLLEATEKERKRLGQELHDGLCQDLKSLEIEMALIEDGLRERGAPEAAEAEATGGRLNLAVKSAYAIVRGMLPMGIDGRGLAAGLSELDSLVHVHSEAAFEKDIDMNLRLASDTEDHHLFRIAQELVTNAIRHAGATRIAIAWRLEGDKACLTVRDNGRGLKPAGEGRERGLGLAVVRSRAAAIGAGLRMENPPGGGALIRCACPASRKSPT